jgi:DNA-binding transcriptional ArsR family regulator
MNTPTRTATDTRRPRTRAEQILAAERLRAPATRANTALNARAAHARALADPTRLTIAAALAAADELCVCDLAWVTERAENLVSHHARTLRSLGLATSRRDGKMVLYRLTDTGRALLDAILAGAGTIA